MQSKQWKHPGSPAPKKFKRVRSAGKDMTSVSWDIQWVIMIDYLEQGSHYKWFILCRRIEATTPGNRKKESRKTDSWCSALAGQRPSHNSLRGTQYRSNEGVIEAVNEYLGDQENAFYFEMIKKLETEMGSKHWMIKFSFLVARSTMGKKVFDHFSYSCIVCLKCLPKSHGIVLCNYAEAMMCIMQTVQYET